MDSSSPKLKKQTIEMSVSHQKKKISKMNLPQKNFLDFLNKSPSLPRKKKWYQKLIRIGSKIENCNIKKANQNKVLPFSSHMKRQNLLNYHENMPYDLRDKKGKNYLSIVCLVKKFIQIIKTATFLKKIIGLRSYHFHVIGDTSNFYKKGSEFGESFFSNLANKNSQDYVIF